MWSTGAVISLVSIVFLTIIGAYALIIRHMSNTSKSLARIYETVNKHIQEADIHTKKSEFVNSAVCLEVQKRQTQVMDCLTGKVDEIAKDVKKLLMKG